VPGDVSIVGFDDIPEAAFFAPPLTTVRQDFDALGRDAMAGVLSVLGDDDRMPAPRVPDLVVRASTSAPSRDRSAVTS
jgi:DNA-binding LacI/PurR family transcriptional regulator